MFEVLVIPEGKRQFGYLGVDATIISQLILKE